MKITLTPQILAKWTPDLFQSVQGNSEMFFDPKHDFWIFHDFLDHLALKRPIYEISKSHILVFLVPDGPKNH